MNKQKYKTVMTWMFKLLVILGIGSALDHLFFTTFDLQSPFAAFLLLPFFVILFVFSIGMLAARVENYTTDVE
jgi:hypothetical protein